MGWTRSLSVISIRENEAVSKEQLAKNKERTCYDCLHCKVSRKSLAIRGLCYCEKKKQIKEKTVKYWQKKVVCSHFDDMSA